MFLGTVDWTEVHEDGMELDAFNRFEEPSMLEQCPWCGGVYYNYSDGVVNEEGEFFDDYYHSDPELKNYHPSCWDKRQLVKEGVNVTELSDF